MGTTRYKGLHLDGQECRQVNDALTVEAPLQIDINGTPFIVTMRTPGADYDLIKGLLYSEDIYRASLPLSFKIVENHPEGYPQIINVIIPNSQLRNGFANSRNLLSVSSCGICGIRELRELKKSHQKLKERVKLNTQHIKAMFDKMETEQHHFNESGGSHAAAVFNKEFELLTVCEDIGRHNAVDKAVGTLLTTTRLSEAEFLLVSGRVSYEIVTKCFSAGIPYLSAVSAPSSLAVDFAKELGITLMGFTRGYKTTVYSHLERILA